MKILFVGADSRLAHDLRAALTGDEIIGARHAALDICDQTVVSRWVNEVRPECIINTAAFHMVDECEDHAQNAFAVNVVGVYHLACAAQRMGALLVHFSTDFVFDGCKGLPYVEHDPVRPLSVYGMSKLAGEWILREYCEKYLIVRTSTLYGATQNGSKLSFVEKVLQEAAAGRPVRAVCDQTRSPTGTWDLGAKLAPLIRERQCGLFHMTNTGQCSLYEFAREALRQAGFCPAVIPVTTAEFGVKARRPVYSALENAALRAAGFTDLLPWQEALAMYLHERKKQT